MLLCPFLQLQCANCGERTPKWVYATLLVSALQCTLLVGVPLALFSHAHSSKGVWYIWCALTNTQMPQILLL